MIFISIEDKCDFYYIYFNKTSYLKLDPSFLS